VTEKMTDDLREELEQDHFCGVPALEIIDAQAAVIERPELRARVAELEAERGAVDLDETLAKLTLANARADAAERHVRDQQDEIRICLGDRNEACERMKRAESEVAALRAELATCTKVAEAHVRDNRELRSEVERLDSAYTVELSRGPTAHEWKVCHSAKVTAESRLCTATQLLRETVGSGSADLWNRIRAFLSTAPAPTEREAAERKVLEAMRGADIKLLRELLASTDRSRRDIASAEFARREAAQHTAPVAPGGDGGGI
jgi:hypothetical protein